CGRLHEVTDVRHPDSIPVETVGALHLHSDDSSEALVQDCLADKRVPPHLLAHVIQRDAVLPGLPDDCSCILPVSVKVEEVGVGRDLARLMELHGCLDEARVPPYKSVHVSYVDIAH